jgi:hypothetical protein
MWYPAEISFTSYLPFELEEGMLFINRISVGVIEPYIELFELEEVPEDPDAFMSKHGAPVRLAIIDEDDDVLAEHDEIAWWDDGPESDELRDITLDDINYILRELDGCVDVEIEDDDDEFTIVTYDGRIVLSLIDDDDFSDLDVTLNDGLEQE